MNSKIPIFSIFNKSRPNRKNILRNKWFEIPGRCYMSRCLRPYVLHSPLFSHPAAWFSVASGHFIVALTPTLAKIRFKRDNEKAIKDFNNQRNKSRINYSVHIVPCALLAGSKRIDAVTGKNTSCATVLKQRLEKSLSLSFPTSNDASRSHKITSHSSPWHV